MVDELGLRERKKLRTRRALIVSAIALFAEQGFEQTTIDQIVQKADVSKRTFFGYFASKEDVLFYDTEERLDRALDAISNRPPGVAPAELLVTVVVQAASDPDANALGAEMSRARERLIISTPALRGRALEFIVDMQRRLSEALHWAYANELDLIEASALVGSIVGGPTIAAVTTLSRGEPPEQVWAAARRAIEIVRRGLSSPPSPR